MRIGISVASCFGDSFYEKLRSFGFDCLDFGMSDTECALYRYSDEEFGAALKRERASAEAAGISIHQVHGPWRYPPRDETEADRRERMEKMKRSIRGAALLGAKYWIVHPLMPFGVKDIPLGKEADTRALNLSFMRELLVTAREEGVTVCLENMPFVDFSLSSPAAIAELVHEIDDPFLAMCLDTGHANVHPDWHTPAATVRAFGDIVKALHVHDNQGRRDEHLTPFGGTIDWKDFSAALREVSFDGVLSLECAPNLGLPADILEDMFVLYFRIARAVEDAFLT